MKALTAAIVLSSLTVLVVTAGILGLVLVGAKDSSVQVLPPGVRDEQQREANRRLHEYPPATCAELTHAPGLSLQALQGFWVLQEKLEFPDGLHLHHPTLPNRDQTMLCLRTELVPSGENDAALKTAFYYKHRHTKNYTGFIKVKENGRWNFHVLSKDHDGFVVDFESTSHFTFVECVPPPESSTPETAVGAEGKVAPEGGGTGGTVESAAQTIGVPASVFVYSRGVLPVPEMKKLRSTIDDILRHKDETFLDFGSYCF